MNILFQIFGFASLSAVIISTITFILQTSLDVTDNKIVAKLLSIIDDVTIMFFTVEYILRFFCCPRKLRFWTECVTNKTPNEPNDDKLT